MVSELPVATSLRSHDGRQRLIHLTSKGREMLPKLETYWEATTHAAAALDAELPFPLGQIVEHAIAALIQRPFESRIAEARAKLVRRRKPKSRR